MVSLPKPFDYSYIRLRPVRSERNGRVLNSLFADIYFLSEKFVINGGKPLFGEIEVLGAKNAALPILAATILIKDDCIISNLPLVKDILTMIEIIKSMGAKVDWRDQRTVKINASGVDPARLNKDLIGKFRGSILLLGPLLARFGEARIPYPGGCLIGSRPIDTHLDGFLKLGVKVFEDENKCFIGLSGKIQPLEEIVLREFSVTATENLLLALSLTETNTKIKIAASDYQVQDLCVFLKKAGVNIEHKGFHTIEIRGKENLKGVDHSIIPDPIEAGTFIIAGALNKGEIKVKNVLKEHLDLFLEKLREFNATFTLTKQKEPELVTVAVSHSKGLRGAKVQILPPPGIYPDFQPLFGLLATQATGTSLIHDPMYEARFGYLGALKNMGADIVIADPHRAMVTGPTALSGVEIPSFDLRAGATLILAGLIAKGMTIINDTHQVDRGYERIDERLRSIGADIQRVNG